MAIKVRIPTPLRGLTNGQEVVTADGNTITQVVDSLMKQYPGLRDRICDDKGQLRRFINFYLNDEDIRFKKGSETPVKEGDELSIIPAIAGGR